MFIIVPQNKINASIFLYNVLFCMTKNVKLRHGYSSNEGFVMHNSIEILHALKLFCKLSKYITLPICMKLR